MADDEGRQAGAATDGDARERELRERMRRRFALAGDGAASKGFFETLLAYYLSRQETGR